MFVLGASRARLTSSNASWILSTVGEVMNPTTAMYDAAVYDRELADVVYRMYEPDFVAFGYERDSWLFDYR